MKKNIFFAIGLIVLSVSSHIQAAAAAAPMRASVSVLDRMALHPKEYARLFFDTKGYAAWQGSMFNDFQIHDFTVNQASSMTDLATKVYALIQHIISLQKEIFSLQKEVADLKVEARIQSEIDVALAESLLS